MCETEHAEYYERVGIFILETPKDLGRLYEMAPVRIVSALSLLEADIAECACSVPSLREPNSLVSSSGDETPSWVHPELPAYTFLSNVKRDVTPLKYSLYWVDLGDT